MKASGRGAAYPRFSPFRGNLLAIGTGQPSPQLGQNRALPVVSFSFDLISRYCFRTSRSSSDSSWRHVTSSRYFGIVGNGKLHVLDIAAPGLALGPLAHS